MSERIERMKRFSIAFLVLVLLFSTVSLANDVEADLDSSKVTVLNLEGDPRFTHLGHITIGLDIDENGHITYSGSARTFGYDLRITLTLQRSSNDVFWDDLECYINTGYNYVSSGGDRYVSEDDFFYRAKIVAEVLDDDRNVLESVTAYSSEERY